MDLSFNKWYIAVVVGFYMLTTLTQKHRTTASYEYYTFWNRRFKISFVNIIIIRMCFFIIKYLKKNKPRICKKTENRFSTSKLQGFRWFLKAFFERTKTHNENQVPGLQVLASLVERGEPREPIGCKKQAENIYCFWIGVLTHTIHVWFVYLPLVDFYGNC